MHGNYSPYSFNVYLIWMFGSDAENCIRIPKKKKKFQYFYIVCGLGAARFYAWLVLLYWNQFSTGFRYIKNNFTFGHFETFFPNHIGDYFKPDNVAGTDWRQ